MTTAYKPGDAITWTHYSCPGAGWQPPAERAGTVWSGAALDTGVSNAWWVHPDEPLDGDLYHMIYVGRSSRKPLYCEAGPDKGEVYCGYRPHDITAVRMAHAQCVADETGRVALARRGSYAEAA